MSFLDDVVTRLLGTKQTGPKAAESNVTRYPAGTPATRTGTLTHADAGLPSDGSGPERVVVLLGPGATFEGIATTLLPLFPAAAAGGAAPPTAGQLAQALVVYAKDYLPATDWSHHQVGLRLPVPIEIDPAGGWVVNANTVRTLASHFLPTGRSRLRVPPAPLPVPDPFALQISAGALIAGFAPPTALAAELWTRTIRNPYEVVLLLFAVLRALDAATPPNQSADVVLAMLNQATAQQVAMLAATDAGNGILRRLADIMAKATPGVDPARAVRITAVRALLHGALFNGSQAGAPVVSHSGLPETPDQLLLRPGSAHPAADANDDPVGGLHRLVLGRDLAVGQTGRRIDGGKTYVGPEFAGRVGLVPYLIADAPHLDPPPGNSRTAALLTVLGGPRAGVGALDAVAAHGPDLLTVGLDHWGAGAADALPSLLLAFKKAAADEFDLFFALHGLDVDAPDAAHPARGRLLRLGVDGSPVPMDSAALQVFLGGGVSADGGVSFDPEWAARFRLPALVSLSYRRVQVAQALIRLNGITPRANIDDLTPAPALPVPLVRDRLSITSTTRTFTTMTPDSTISGLGNFWREVDAGVLKVGKIAVDNNLVVADPAHAGQFLVPTQMRIAYPEDAARPGRVAGSGKLPVVVIVHGNHAAFDANFPPSTTMVTVNDPINGPRVRPLFDSASVVAAVANHEGYGRLQDLLATVGIVSVSVSTNLANFFDVLIRMRTRTVIAALEHLQKLDIDPASIYFGRLDLHNIGLMGHSRGGDVVVDAAKLVQGRLDLTVKAVCSLSPTDFSGLADDATQLKLTAADAAFYLVVYGGLDGDVSGLKGAAARGGSGFRHYDRATCPKAMVQLSRCCHNRFNSVWSDGTPTDPTDPVKKFQGDDSDLVPTDIPLLRSFDDHQKLEVEYVGGMLRWQLLGDRAARDLFDGNRANSVGVPASLQWSFGDAPRPALRNVDNVVDVDDLENVTAPNRPGATRTLAAGGRIGFADVTVPGSTIKAGEPTTPVTIVEHVTHPSEILRVDASVATTTAVAMKLGFPVPVADGSGPGNWYGFTFLTFRLSYTLDITSAANLASSPKPKISLTLTDHGGRSRRLPDAAAFTPGVPSAPDFHLVKDRDDHGVAIISNATLFRFETLRVPLLEFARRGIHLDSVKELAVEFDQSVKTRVLFDSFELVAF